MHAHAHAYVPRQTRPRAEKYIILTALPWHKRFGLRSSMLCDTYIACFVNLYFDELVNLSIYFFIYEITLCCTWLMCKSLQLDFSYLLFIAPGETVCPSVKILRDFLFIETFLQIYSNLNFPVDMFLKGKFATLTLAQLMIQKGQYSKKCFQSPHKNINCSTK
jgi:hypothetical protein